MCHLLMISYDYDLETNGLKQLLAKWSGYRSGKPRGPPIYNLVKLDPCQYYNHCCTA